MLTTPLARRPAASLPLYRLVRTSSSLKDLAPAVVRWKANLHGCSCVFEVHPSAFFESLPTISHRLENISLVIMRACWSTFFPRSNLWFTTAPRRITWHFPYRFSPAIQCVLALAGFKSVTLVDVELLFALLWWSLPFYFFVVAISLTHELMISTEGFNHQARL